MKDYPHPHPGDIYQSIGDGDTFTYVMLSADDDEEGRHVWKAAKFYEGNYWRHGWMGAQVIDLWEGDIGRLRLVGYLQQRHTWLPRLCRNLSKRWNAIRLRIRCYFLHRKYGYPFWKNPQYWKDDT